MSLTQALYSLHHMHLPIYLPICLSYLSSYLFILSVFLFVYPICLPICLSYLSSYLFILPVFLFAYPICLPIVYPICLPICLSYKSSYLFTLFVFLFVYPICLHNCHDTFFCTGSRENSRRWAEAPPVLWDTEEDIHNGCPVLGLLGSCSRDQLLAWVSWLECLPALPCILDASSEVPGYLGVFLSVCSTSGQVLKTNLFERR